jgi:hypothetical protein
MMSKDPMAANRVMAAQAIGVCGKPDLAFTAILNEANAVSNGYVLFQSLNAFQYAHVDGRLTKADWNRFGKLRANATRAIDEYGFEYADRIINDARSIWPETRAVD